MFGYKLDGREKLTLLTLTLGSGALFFAHLTSSDQKPDPKPVAVAQAILSPHLLYRCGTNEPWKPLPIFQNIKFSDAPFLLDVAISPCRGDISLKSNQGDPIHFTHASNADSLPAGGPYPSAVYSGLAGNSRLAGLNDHDVVAGTFVQQPRDGKPALMIAAPPRRPGMPKLDGSQPVDTTYKDGTATIHFRLIP